MSRRAKRVAKRLGRGFKRAEPLPLTGEAESTMAAPPKPELVKPLLSEKERLETDLRNFRRVMDPEEVRDVLDHIDEIVRKLGKLGFRQVRLPQAPISGAQTPVGTNYAKATPIHPHVDQPLANPTPDGYGQKPLMPKRIPQGRVVVDRGRRTYHATTKCPRAKHASFLCDSVGAHFSPLQPCSKCATELAQALAIAYGVVTLAERARRGLPMFTPSRANGKPRTSGTKKQRTSRRSSRKKTDTYGSPTTNDDARFTHKSRLEIGMAAYRQNSNEFLAEPTDDDHDWRGGASMFE